MQMRQDVLIVDDDGAVLIAWRRMLETGGYRVHSAENALQALQLVRNIRPRVALCDVHMPGRSGLWLAEQIRADAPSTAIIIATGDQHVPPADSLGPGIIGYLLKPLSLD